MSGGFLEGEDPGPVFRDLVLAIVAKIPKGRLASYGQIAMLAGFPRRPRQVGMVLRGLPEATKLPWHRVVNNQGYVPSKGRWWGAMVQIERIREEGIEVANDGTLDLEAHRWRPRGNFNLSLPGPRKGGKKKNGF